MLLFFTADEIIQLDPSMYGCKKTPATGRKTFVVAIFMYV